MLVLLGRGFTRLLLAAAFCLSAPHSSRASDVSSQVAVVSLSQVSATRVGRTAFEYIYRVNLRNSGSELYGVVATASSANPATTIVDPTVNVGDLASGATSAAADTFSFRQDRTVPFDTAAIRWTIDGSQTSLELSLSTDKQVYSPNEVPQLTLRFCNRSNTSRTIEGAPALSVVEADLRKGGIRLTPSFRTITSHVSFDALRFEDFREVAPASCWSGCPGG